jgi:hypothetical protein
MPATLISAMVRLTPMEPETLPFWVNLAARITQPVNLVQV